MCYSELLIIFYVYSELSLHCFRSKILLDHESCFLCFFLTGFAFIEFEDIRDAEDAVRDMDGRYVCGVRIRVEMAKNSSK